LILLSFLWRIVFLFFMLAHQLQLC
jgi:hypothetical protein